MMNNEGRAGFSVTGHDSGTCIVCPEHGLPILLFKKNGYSISRCDKCGVIMSGGQFVPDQYEDKDYYTMSRSSVEALYDQWAFRWRWILGSIASVRPGNSLLDVGAGNGLFVKIAREEFRYDAEGIEFSQVQCEFAERVLGQRLLNASLSEIDREFHIVTCFNVIEHVFDPLQMAREIAAHVRRGGLAIVTTPSPDCIKARVKGLARWNMISPPHHLNIFSREALELMLRHAGLNPTRYATLSTYMNALVRFRGGRELPRRIAFNALKLFGLGADHFVVAEK